MWTHERDYDQLVADAAARERPVGWSVDAFAALIKAVMARESSFDQTAVGPEPTIVSRGLMQVTERTARDLGYLGSLGDDHTGTGGLYDPRTSINLGAQLLHRNLNYARQYLDAAISAYNAGFGDPPFWQGRQTSPGVFVNQGYVNDVKRYFAYFLAQHGASQPLGTSPPLTFPPSTSAQTGPLKWIVIAAVGLGAAVLASWLVFNAR